MRNLQQNKNESERLPEMLCVIKKRLNIKKLLQVIHHENRVASELLAVYDRNLRCGKETKPSLKVLGVHARIQTSVEDTKLVVKQSICLNYEPTQCICILYHQ